MVKEIYGLDITKEITPTQVRDAIIRCFYEAHKEVVAKQIELPENMKVGITVEAIRAIVKDKFEKVGGNFNRPTKKSLFLVICELQNLAMQFRDIDVIMKHYLEIMTLLKRL